MTEIYFFHPKPFILTITPSGVIDGILTVAEWDAIHGRNAHRSIKWKRNELEFNKGRGAPFADVEFGNVAINGIELLFLSIALCRKRGGSVSADVVASYFAMQSQSAVLNYHRYVLPALLDNIPLSELHQGSEVQYSVAEARSGPHAAFWERAVLERQAAHAEALAALNRMRLWAGVATITEFFDIPKVRDALKELGLEWLRDEML